MNWKVLAPIAACVFVSLSTAGCHSEVVVRTRPPADRVEVQTAAPSAQHFWVRGHWQWNGGSHDWMPGHWEARRTSHVYQPGHWVESGGGWVWVESRWVER